MKMKERGGETKDEGRGGEGEEKKRGEETRREREREGGRKVERKILVSMLVVKTTTPLNLSIWYNRRPY